MKIALDQIRETPRALSYVEEVEDLNRELERGAGDFRLPEGLAVDVSYHRAALDVFVDGTLRARVGGTCARCLGEYTFPLEAPIALVLTPAAASTARSGALREGAVGLAEDGGEGGAREP